MKLQIPTEFELNKCFLIPTTAVFLTLFVWTGAGTEVYTLRTYYPSPYGSYKRMKVVESITGGENGAPLNIIGNTVINPPGSAASTTVSVYDNKSALADVNGYSAANDVWLKDANRWASKSYNPKFHSVHFTFGGLLAYGRDVVPKASGTYSYALPAAIPSTASEILVHLYQMNEYSPNTGRNTITIYTQENGEKYLFPVYFYPFPQAAVSPDNVYVWLPVTKERKLYLTRDVDRSITYCFDELFIEAWR